MVLERRGDFSLIWLGFMVEKERKEEEKKKKEEEKKKKIQVWNFGLEVMNGTTINLFLFKLGRKKNPIRNVIG